MSRTLVTTPKTRLLLVDDHPGNLLALEAVLQGPEYELVQAQSGRQAITLAQQYADWALILLDVHMPELDGFQTATLIKQIEHCREIPIIFISAVYTESSFVKKGYEVGAIDYFGKPFDPDILKLKVRLYASYRQKILLLKEEQQRIHESKALIKVGKKLLDLCQTKQVGVIITDTTNHIHHINDEILRIFELPDISTGYANSFLLQWWEREGNTIVSQTNEPSDLFLTGWKSQSKSVEITCLDGTKKLVTCTASSLQGNSNTLSKLVTMQDITEKKYLEQNLEACLVKFNSLHSTVLNLTE